MQTLGLKGILSRITSTLDGGWKITFDVDQSETPAIQELVLLKDAYLSIQLKDAHEKSQAY